MATRIYEFSKTSLKKKHVTEELYALPKYPFYELYDGVMRVRECSGLQSSNVAVELAALLVFHTRTRRLGKIFSSDLRFVLGRNPDTVLAPDVSFIRRARLVYGSAWEKFLEGAPDLAVEVMSPSDRLIALQRKTERYIAAGASLVWIIQPRRRMALVYRKDGTSTLIENEGVLDGEDVVPGFTCSLGGLFVL